MALLFPLRPSLLEPHLSTYLGLELCGLLGASPVASHDNLQHAYNGRISIDYLVN